MECGENFDINFFLWKLKSFQNTKWKKQLFVSKKQQQHKLFKTSTEYDYDFLNINIPALKI